MTPGFSTHILKVSTSDGRNFTLLEDFTYTSNSGVVYTIPAGSQSDGASTPRSIWVEIPPFGTYWIAAFFHDWLYRYSSFPEATCNTLLLEAMLSLGVNPILAKMIYDGVELGGWSSFKADRLAQAAAQAATQVKP